MYLRFATRLEFPKLAKMLRADLTEDSIGWDSENVYEWMYVDLPQLAYSLNVSREHGWADLDDEMIDRCESDDALLNQLVQPGPVHFGWDRNHDRYVDDLPEFLPQLLADALAIEVSIFSGRCNVDVPDAEPIRVISPNSNRQTTK